MPIKVLHVAHMRQPAVGVIRQMEYEQEAATELGISWVSSFYCVGNEDSPITIQTPSGNDLIGSKRDFYRSLMKRAADFDVILLRYAMYDPLQIWFIHNCPIPVVTMHHTLEVRELLSYNNLRSRALAYLEKAIGPFSLRKAAAIAGVTWQVAKYEQTRSNKLSTPIFNYGNGAKFDKDCVIPLTNRNKPYEFLFLSSQYPIWMGLDLFIDAAKNSEAQFKVHIVGKVNAAQKAQLEADDRFVIHGTLDKSAIEKIISQCVLGLSTFAIHRKGFTEGNTLKIREYLRAGLPVYAGYKDIFDDDFPYYRTGPADIEKILEYAEDVIHIDRATVSETAKPLVDKLVVLANIYKDLHTVVSPD